MYGELRRPAILLAYIDGVHTILRRVIASSIQVRQGLVLGLAVFQFCSLATSHASSANLKGVKAKPKFRGQARGCEACTGHHRNVCASWKYRMSHDNSRKSDDNRVEKAACTTVVVAHCWVYRCETFAPPSKKAAVRSNEFAMSGTASDPSESK